MRTLLRHAAISTIAAAALLVAGCSSATDSSTTAAPKTEAAPQIVTAKTAFGAMYKDALAWSSDIQVLRLTPKDLTGYKADAGKAGLWEAVFASPSKHEYRVYTYAIATVLPDARKGVNADIALPWTGFTRDAMPVDLGLFTVDSDAAYQAATADAAAWLKKNPGKPVSAFDLGCTYKFQAPVWYISWGDKKSGYVALVDATSGKVYKSAKS